MEKQGFKICPGPTPVWVRFFTQPARHQARRPEADEIFTWGATRPTPKR